MPVFVNRTLNLKKIKAIGFDMDYTLVQYHTQAFESLTHKNIIDKLISMKGYDPAIRSLTFNNDLVIQGLVIDIKLGNILKLSRYGKVKVAYHGTTKMDFKIQKEIYEKKEIDVSNPHIQSLDTFFSTANGVLYAQLVTMKDEGVKLPEYEKMAYDTKEMLDVCHRDGTLKNEVARNITAYIKPDPELPLLLEEYKKAGKKLIIITNSDYNYTRLLMDHCFTPYLKEHKNWRELFELTVTLSMKPKFFTANTAFLKVDPETCYMQNTEEKITHGIFQGGNATRLMKDLSLFPDEILYIGDHIYGDVVSLKKHFSWRTALVFGPLAEELESIKKGKHCQDQIDQLMSEKEVHEMQLHKLYSKGREKSTSEKEQISALFDKLEKLNQQISKLIEEYQNYFNPYWGERMRAGHEEGYLAGQIEKYACIYMPTVKELLEYPPRSYFRPKRRVMPHEHI